jgi:hypothetical protein
LSNLRGAVSEQCAQVPETPALPKRLLTDLLSCSGWVSLIGSLAITGLASGSAESLLEAVRLGEQGCPVPARAARAAALLVVIARLPREHATLRIAARAALFPRGCWALACSARACCWAGAGASGGRPDQPALPPSLTVARRASTRVLPGKRATRTAGDRGRRFCPAAHLPCYCYGCSTTLVWPSTRLSNFSYAVGASSRGSSWETTKLGVTLPSMMRSRSCRL